MDERTGSAEAVTPMAFESSEVSAVLANLRSTAAGLTPTEAAERLKVFGPNALPAPPRRSALLRFLDQFRNVLVLILIAPAVLNLILGHWLDAAVIMAVVIANAIVGWLQEGRAEQALAAVGKLLAASAVVLREGMRKTVAAAEIVPGDVVFLESGDRVPADLRLIELRSLMVDEALLTGESLPVAKDVAPVAPDLPLAERQSMAFSGTIVTGGQALGVVVATGSTTELGRIGRMVETVEDVTTPFLQRLAKIGRQMTVAILAIAAATVGIGLAIGNLAIEELILAAIGFAVAAIPEGLPAIVTIILAIGVRRMAARGALIRKLPAVETLGSVTVICTDKTGTLTRNELVAREVMTATHRYEVAGDGYVPIGAITDAETGELAGADPELTATIRSGVLCNEGRIRQIGDAWIAEGDPVEAALMALGRKAGIDAGEAGLHRLDLLPFESEWRFMATLNGDADRATAWVKGAPERLLKLCDREGDLAAPAPIDRAGWEQRVIAMAERGLRVLAFAAAPHPPGRPFDRETIGDGLVFLGLIGFIDPPRREAQEAVAECRAAGIAVKMITGDHAETALAVGREIGLDVAAGVLTGAELAALDQDALAKAANETSVFARVDPAQKLRLVDALQQSGHAVAMTGDGVNDAPALRRADIGVAMGSKGSEAAKEAADMVLVDDNFATIASAVREGRSVDDNLRKALRYVLPTNAGESFLLIGAILTGATLPITALQIIWINFATEITLSLSLAFEPRSSKGMRRPPRPRDAGLIGRGDLVRIGVVGIVMAILAGGLFALALAEGRSLEVARAMAVNSVVAAEVGYLFAIATVWPGRGTVRGAGRRVNVAAMAMAVAVMLLQAVVTNVPPIAETLGMAPLGVVDWLLVVGSGVAVYGASWVTDAISGRRGRP